MPELPELAEGDYAARIMPCLVMLFDGLKRAYEAAKDDEDSGDSDSDSDEDEGDQNILSSDEDEIDEASAVYLESLQEKLNKHVNGNVSVSTRQADVPTSML